VSFDLQKTQEAARAIALDGWGEEVSAELVCARLLDGLRDAGVVVPTDKAIADATRGYDKDAWSRLQILVRLFRDEPAIGAEVLACVRRDPECVRDAFFAFCVRDTELLTLELLLKSPFRIEELVRKWIHTLGGEIGGESANESEARMQRIDFGGVMKNLATAQKDRAARQQRLKEMEEERLKKEREAQEAYERAGRE
jgi:hypothetical protein